MHLLQHDQQQACHCCLVCCQDWDQLLILCNKSARPAFPTLQKVQLKQLPFLKTNSLHLKIGQNPETDRESCLNSTIFAGVICQFYGVAIVNSPAKFSNY